MPWGGRLGVRVGEGENRAEGEHLWWRELRRGEVEERWRGRPWPGRGGGGGGGDPASPSAGPPPGQAPGQYLARGYITSHLTVSTSPASLRLVRPALRRWVILVMSTLARPTLSSHRLLRRVGPHPSNSSTWVGK